MIKKISRIVILFIISTSLVILAIFIYQNQIIIKDLSTRTALPEIFPSPPPPSPTPSGKGAIASTPLATQNAIRTNINAKEHKALEPYMAKTVNVVLESSDCCGEKSPQEASDSLNLLNDAIPFDFNQSHEITKKLKSSNQSYSQSLVGVSTRNEQIVAFELDKSNRIAKITMATTWKLYGL